jgi:hypothetical protein
MTVIMHVGGADNIVADELSRPPVATVVPACDGRILDYAAMMAEQQQCKETAAAV